MKHYTVDRRAEITFLEPADETRDRRAQSTFREPADETH
jgi:hypothetical protein